MAPYEDAALHQVMSLPGVGPQIFAMIPLLERVRLRQTCRIFMSAVDESLESISELFSEDIGDVADKGGGLDWLLPRCPNLRTLSLWSRVTDDRPRARYERDDDTEIPVPIGLNSPGMAPQSLAGLKRCARLLHLNLAGCVDVTDDLLAAVAASCRGLDSLDVSECSVTDVGITAIACHCPGLKELTARWARHVTDASVIMLAERCQQLTRLIVTGNFVTDAGISAVAQRCVCLRHLDVERTRVTDASIMLVANRCPQLEYLGIQLVKKARDASIILVASRCSSLTGLNLSISRATDAIARPVADGCPLLEHLDISGCWLSKSGLMDLARGKLTRLRHLDASHVESLDDDVITAFAATCPELRHVAISHSPRVTDAGVLSLAEHCVRLEYLGVSHHVFAFAGWGEGKSVGVTDVSVSEIARRCPRLRHLGVLGCRGVTDASILVVGEHCRELETLNLTVWDDKVTDASLRVVGRKCVRLRSLDVCLDREGGPALCALVENCEWLEHVSVDSYDHGCPIDLDGCMAAIGRTCKRLRSFKTWVPKALSDENIAAMLSGPGAAHVQDLDFSYGCASIADAAMFAIGRACPRLRSLILKDCNKVTDYGLVAIMRGCRRLSFLDGSRTQGTWHCFNVFDSRCTVWHEEYCPYPE